ncbi:29 kDa ribonucleoprotein A, chloroplastic [Syzygium oleosum]|uniref:29 kDa ribonucleoprotein A, chloroplastic n=1 Tax=Syzygium oleosum TaxID=219896 RepID=UPI0024B8E9C2|nr:29 kDa ribonucleoprotein A, chloroplastic [Syzygium oleosum]
MSTLSSAAAAAASTLVLPSFAPRAAAAAAPRFLALKPAPVALSLHHLKPLAASPPPLYSAAAASSRFLRRVFVSSDVDQEEGEGGFLSDDGGRASFSPDLKLFVGNLPFTVDSAQLAGLFESAGNVEMVEVIYDKDTGRSRGFGFVTMSTAEEVEAAAQQFNGYELDGRPLRVNAGPPPARRDGPPPRMGRGGGGGMGGANSSNRVYVGNLSWGVDDLALETLFSEQGRVLEAKVVYDRETGRSRGFGFVSYGSADEVNNAIDSLNGVDLNGRSIRVTHAEAKPRRQF